MRGKTVGTHTHLNDGRADPCADPIPLSPPYQGGCRRQGDPICRDHKSIWYQYHSSPPLLLISPAPPAPPAPPASLCSLQRF
jgi:hypothetical protein